MREVFLDDLPRWDSGTNKGKINWESVTNSSVKFVYDNIKGEIEVINYDKKSQYLTVKYNNKTFDIKAYEFSKCKISRIVGKRNRDFKVEIGEVFNSNERDLLIIDREYRRFEHKPDAKKRVYMQDIKWYKYICGKCSYTGWIYESDLLKGQGCSCCCGRISVLGINTIWDTDRFLLDLGISEDDAKKYSKASNKKITATCPDCNSKKDILISSVYKNKSIGCICGDGYSRGHKYVYELISQLNLDFKDNYKPDWCKYYNKYKNKKSSGEYDFIIEDMKLIIEVDGEFHRANNTMNGQTKEESKYIDNMKDELAIKNKYRIIRIPYGIGDFRENISNSKLTNIFDLSKIDWEKCEEFAVKSNMLKKVCEYWVSKEGWETASDVGKEFNINRSTVVRYLKKGSKIWNWCKYDANEESRKSYLMNSEKNKLRCNKKVEMFKDDVSLGIFESCSELFRLSEELFGVRLNTTCIGLVAKGRQNSHKGYTFKYVE